MNTYLVTGAGGFIGSKTSELLLAQGHRVIGVDNLNDYYDVRLKGWRLERLKGLRGFSFVEMDIEHREEVSTLFSDHNFDGVLNLAARAGVRYSLENPHIYMTTNAMGTLNLLESMKETGVKKMVLASTSSLYAGQKMPFLETLAVNTPISPYAASKKAAEVLAYSYHKLYGLDVSVLRYFTVFGPAGRPDMAIYRFIQGVANGSPLEIYGDGSQSRDFTFVDDIARGTIAAMRDVGYEIINIGGGNNPISLSKVIQWIEERVGQKAKLKFREFHHADMLITWADRGKARKLLDWYPEVDIKTGIERTVDWHLEHQSLLTDLR